MVDQQPPQPKKNNVLAAVAACLAFGGIAFASFKLLSGQKDMSKEEKPVKKSDEGKSAKEIADAEKRRLMSEIGKKGAAKRWANKKAQDQVEEQDDEPAIQT